MKTLLLRLVRKALGPDFDVEKHFTPQYAPWDQRVCLIPDNDLFDAINSGRVSIRTEEIDRFTPDGLRLASGEVVRADVIVVATGLRLQVLNGLSLSVDGKPVNAPDHLSYQGMMLSDVPNLILTFGYINSSWTLRADLTAEFACRVVNELDRTGNRQATPCITEKAMREMPLKPWIDCFSSGYIQRAMQRFPKQGDRNPWRNTQDYHADRKSLRKAPLADGALQLSNPQRQLKVPQVHGIPTAQMRRRVRNHLVFAAVRLRRQGRPAPQAGKRLRAA